jgi:Reductase C-terminal
MLGSTVPYGYLHSFWSDQFEHKIEYAGYATRWDEFVARGSVEEGKLIGFYLVDGVVRAAVGLDRDGDPELDLDGEMAACARLVAARAGAAFSGLLPDGRTPDRACPPKTRDRLLCRSPRPPGSAIQMRRRRARRGPARPGRRPDRTRTPANRPAEAPGWPSPAAL